MNETTDIIVDEKQLLDLLSKLIAINSVNPCLGPGGKGEMEIAAFIGETFEQIGLEVEFKKFGTDRVNVVGLLKGSGDGQSIMLNGHTDTVTANAMEIDPFKPVVKDGNVYGRGALDMKSGVAAQIMAVRAIIQSGIRLKGDIILACVADEEYISIGTEALLQDFTADAAVICEPTDLEIVIAHKGFAWAAVEVFGKAAHGSRPQEGIDAIIKSAKVLAGLDRLNSEVLVKKEHPLLGNPSIHASMIKGGSEWSTYPDYCKIELERRTLPGENKDTVAKELQLLLDDIKQEDREFKADFDIVCFRQPFEISRERQIVKCLEQACLKVMDKKPRFSGASFWMDSALLSAARIPTVIFGPAGEGLHAAVEYVNFDSVVTTANVLVRTIVDFCNNSASGGSEPF
jgi:acetylornithine deacetylase